MSVVMLIYEIVNNKYRVELKTLCCVHDWIRVFAFLGTGHEVSCSSRYSALFPRNKSLRVEVLPKVSPQESPLSRVAFFYLYERARVLPYLPSIVLSCLWDGSLDVWLWVDWWRFCGRDVLSVVIRAEVIIHPAWSSYMSSVHPLVWLKPLATIAIGQLHKWVGHWRFLILEIP